MDLWQESKDKIKQILNSNKDTSTRSHVRLHEVKPDTIREILLLTEIDITGYKNSIDRSEVNHTLNNHSNNKKEMNRGQIPVNNDDFLLIPEIIDCPDNIIFAGTDRIGRETIRFEKVIII